MVTISPQPISLKTYKKVRRIINWSAIAIVGAMYLFIKPRVKEETPPKPEIDLSLARPACTLSLLPAVILQSEETQNVSDESIIHEIQRILGSESFDHMREEEQIKERYEQELTMFSQYLDSLEKDKKTPGEAKRKEFLEQEEARTRKVIEGHNIRLAEINKTHEVLRKRAVYNLTKNPAVFNDYLPYRNSIRNNKEKLEAYEKIVRHIQDTAHFRYVTELDKDDCKNLFCTNYFEMWSVDPSTRYMVSALIAELYHNRFDEIDRILHRKGKLEICLVEEDSFRLNFYLGERNIIVVGYDPMWYSIAMSYYTDLPHEFDHSVDVEDKKGGYIEFDGLPSGLTSSQAETFKKERERLFNVFNKYRESLSEEEIKEINAQLYDPATGLLNYAFGVQKLFGIELNPNAEFFATSMEIFNKEPERLKAASEGIYNIFRDYVRYDPLTQQDIEPIETKEQKNTKILVQRQDF